MSFKQIDSNETEHSEWTACLMIQLKCTLFQGITFACHRSNEKEKKKIRENFLGFHLTDK